MEFTDAFQTGVSEHAKSLNVFLAHCPIPGSKSAKLGRSDNRKNRVLTFFHCPEH
jgi:hypothetical protein